MEIKRLITQFTYRIEPKPEGGFVAHATDPSVPPLEAATREELQQKIQATIAAGLASVFPGMKLPLENKELKLDFHIEHTPGGGLAIHSGNADTQPIAGTHEEIESRFAEKLVNFVGKHLPPELQAALASQGLSGDVKVFVNRKTNFPMKPGTRLLRPSGSQTQGFAGSTPLDNPDLEGTQSADARMLDASFGSLGDTISNSPITPERSSSWIIIRFLLTLLVLAALMYFFLHRR